MNYVVLHHLNPLFDCHAHDFLVQYLGTKKYFKHRFNMQNGKRISHLYV